MVDFPLQYTTAASVRIGIFTGFVLLFILFYSFSYGSASIHKLTKLSRFLRRKIILFLKNGENNMSLESYFK